jgi:hypothetical protein
MNIVRVQISSQGQLLLDEPSPTQNWTIIQELCLRHVIDKHHKEHPTGHQYTIRLLDETKGEMRVAEIRMPSENKIAIILGNKKPEEVSDSDCSVFGSTEDLTQVCISSESSAPL